MESKCFSVRLSSKATIVALLGVTALNLIFCFVDMEYIYEVS